MHMVPPFGKLPNITRYPCDGPSLTAYAMLLMPYTRLHLASSTWFGLVRFIRAFKVAAAAALLLEVHRSEPLSSALLLLAQASCNAVLPSLQSLYNLMCIHFVHVLIGYQLQSN